jgi:preprotein translocase subunit SecG
MCKQVFATYPGIHNSMHSVTAVSKFCWLYVNITLQLISKKQHTENRSFEFCNGPCDGNLMYF